VARPSSSQQPPEQGVVGGKVTTVHGVRGWLKIHSFTIPEGNIFDYQPWWIEMPDGWTTVEIDSFQPVAKGFIAHIKGLDDRDEARKYCQREIYVSTEAFPPAEEGEYYWHQLEGLQVVSVFDGNERVLGTLSGFLETGANDVMQVSPSADSIDDVERLLPYIDQVIVEVDLASGVIRVDWDPEFETSKD
jgi:16S rRNA processing protein RimM